MEILYVFLQGIYSIVLCLTVFVLIHFLSSNMTQKDGKEPPGPTPLPMFGNLLQLDLKRIHVTLLEVRKSLVICSFNISDHFNVFLKRIYEHVLLFLAIKKIWIYFYHLSGDQKSGGPGRIQRSKGGTC